ncbi:MAG: dipeptidyl peptidase 3 [Bacteroidales bacterium]|nr:dipeptidyl peptidase 3 [Bacteroidales bacterium]
MIAIAAGIAAASACAPKNTEFKYSIDSFADLRIMRYQVPGWENLSLEQKEYIFHLSEAAKLGRDITWDQYCRFNLPVRHAIEDIFANYSGPREGEDWDAFVVYAKRVFFSNGIHHHYAEDKFFPACSREYFASLLADISSDGQTDPDQGDAAQGDAAPVFWTGAEGLTLTAEQLLDVVYNPDLYPQRRSTDSSKDIVAASAVNFYGEGISRKEVDDFYARQAVKGDKHPVSYGLNSKVVKEKGRLVEKKWKVDGIYSDAIKRICAELRKAQAVAENELQKEAIDKLIEYYTTGDLRTWDDYNILWVQDTLGTVDYVNGFIEDYDDPLGRKATWEGLVNIKDQEASRRTEILSANAQWFEDNSPVDARFKKAECKGITAKVINAVALAGATYPSTPIGINLPNADWIRKEHGSKSVTIANITHAYDAAALEQPKSVLAEFAWDQAEIDLVKKWGDTMSEIHTDLHECLGHGSGQLLPGVSSTALGEYQSALEEARADLFGLYYCADPKMVELGIVPDREAYKSEYASYIRNGLMTQFTRVELGKQNTEAHMQNRQLVAEWCYEQGAADGVKGAPGSVIEKRVREGKTYFVVNDYKALRELFGKLLGEIQRIKSEGDYEAGKALVEKYGVNIDPELHKEVLERYTGLNLKPYGGFVNPEIRPVFGDDGAIVDYAISYPEDYLAQMLYYGERYRTL